VNLVQRYETRIDGLLEPLPPVVLDAVPPSSGLQRGRSRPIDIVPGWAVTNVVLALVYLFGSYGLFVWRPAAGWLAFALAALVEGYRALELLRPRSVWGCAPLSGTERWTGAMALVIGPGCALVGCLVPWVFG
jgi:hypothetical protein